ncbi:MAG: hypothetical protein HKM03_00845, partial [Steroidobacteraceae bacterium]|nr:hypothetical protein [Steroidobacteraceae bacterium]
MLRLTGSVPAALTRATLIDHPGDAAREANEPLTVTLVLERDHERAFTRYLHELYRPGSPEYHHFLTQRAIADRFGPSRAEYSGVVAYLRDRGFKLLKGSANRLTVTMRGTRALTERAFDVAIRDYRLDHRRFHANSADPALPASIAPHVQAIVGLSDLARPWRVGTAGEAIWSNIPPQGQFLISCFSPALAESIKNLKIEEAPGLAAAIEAVTAPVACELNMIAAYAASYGAFPDPTPGTGQTIGLLEFDNFHPSDVQDYLDLMGVGGQFSQLSEVDVGAGAGPPGPGESEVLLDADIAMSLAPGAHVAVYDGSFQGAGSFQAMFNAMINGGVNVISNSWAACENQESTADVQSLNSVLANAAAAGITVISGSGDDGSTCLDGAANTAAVPADSPNVTTVGGTTATPTVAGAYQSEQWWDGTSHTPPTGQGGFGVSKFFGVPSYQASLTSATGRSVPDVVAPADPAEGWTLCQADHGGCPAPFLFGGTSAAAPVFASLIAVLNQELGHNLGFLNPALYSLAGSSAFHSAASMGSDFAHVGLGSPNVNELRRLLAGGTTGGVDMAHSGIVVPPIPVTADGHSAMPVSVTLLDNNFYTVSGQSVTLSANSGSHALITTVRGTTDLDSGAALFEVTDTVPETVTLTASTSAGALPGTATVSFVSPPAASGGISASPTTVTADGVSTTGITVTLKDANGNPSPYKVVGLAQGNGGSQISAATATTDSTGTVNFTATDDLAQTVTYTATDITDGNLPVPGSAQVQFTNAPATPPCNVGLGTAAAGYAVSTFASGFAYNGGLCFGPIGLTFDPQGNLLVADNFTGLLYQFSPQGGSADPGRVIGNPFNGAGLNGLVFGKDGSLYATGRAGPVCVIVNAVVQIDPQTGQITRYLNAPGCPTGIAVDPLSGDLFISGYGGIFRLSNFATGAGTLINYSTVGADGMTFAPDGTLYASDNGSGVVYSITGTNSATPGVATAIASVPGADGITLVTNPGNAALPYVVVNSNAGDIVKIDQTTSPATVTTIYSGGSRGDFVTVGPDACMYAIQTDRVIKITNADGSCSFQPIAVAPAVALTPAVVAPDPTQGSSITLTAQLQNMANPAGVPVQLLVTGANPKVYAGATDANGRVSFTLTGVEPGEDRATAVISSNGTALPSNAVQVQWLAGPHTTFIGLNQNPDSDTAGTPITLTGTLVDVSASPAAALSSQTIEFTLDGQSCSAATDGTGTGSCAVTPTTSGVATLNAAFVGGTAYMAAQATRRIDVQVAAPAVSIAVNPTPIVVGSNATLTWSSANATSCTASGAWSGTQATSGSQTVSPAVAGSDTYTLSCTGAGGTASASTVLAATAPPPTATIGVTPTSIAVGGSATLTWSSTNASACTASGAWSGTQATSGSQTVSPSVTGSDTYTLSCTGTGGTASASAVLAATLVSVTVAAHSGGGGTMSIPVLVLLGGLVVLRWLARRDSAGVRRSMLMVLMLVAGGSTGVAHAASQVLLDRLYLGVRVGAMPLSINAGSIDARLAASGFGSVTAQQNTSGTGETLYLGVQLSRYNAFEIAYTNRESQVASLAGTLGSVTDLPALLSTAAGSLRGYGNIFSASYRARIHLLNRLYLDPRVGAFYWSTRERILGPGTSFT